ncbi:MAG: hypothetical protein OEW19_10415 [Acidobacteriota bacterium]|nr:hypothetical protein [Acidobacteriota bacterium]
MTDHPDTMSPHVHETTAVDVPPLPTCPLCHTPDRTTTVGALAGGADWRCARCSQRWDAERLATVAAFERAGHNAVAA